MKICLYTVSNFNSGSLDCINLLISSITDNNYTFYILSNNSSPYSNTNHNIVYDTEVASDYVGYLKYSPSLPKDYDYYVYLDSDILFFDTISSLICINKEFSIVREKCLVSENKEWFYFNYLSDKEDIYKTQNAQALNAGSFAFRNDQFAVIEKIYNYYKTHHNHNTNHNVRLEQSIYNFVINKQSDYTLQNCYDITDKTLLFASGKDKINNKTLYHFCGYTNEMITKYNNMKVFYDKYKKSNS